MGGRGSGGERFRLGRMYNIGACVALVFCILPIAVLIFPVTALCSVGLGGAWAGLALWKAVGANACLPRCLSRSYPVDHGALCETVHVSSRGYPEFVDLIVVLSLSYPRLCNRLLLTQITVRNSSGVLQHGLAQKMTYSKQGLN